MEAGAVFGDVIFRLNGGSLMFPAAPNAVSVDLFGLGVVAFGSIPSLYLYLSGKSKDRQAALATALGCLTYHSATFCVLAYRGYLGLESPGPAVVDASLEYLTGLVIHGGMAVGFGNWFAKTGSRVKRD